MAGGRWSVVGGRWSVAGKKFARVLTTKRISDSDSGPILILTSDI